jgi:DNA primase catalytic subunit
MLTISTTLKHYKREDIQEAMLNSSQNREVAVRYGDSGYGKRPDSLQYPRDVLEFAKQGATSFHVSEEHWHNVYRLSPVLKKEELEALRTGWDLVIDIDCPDLKLSRIIAWLVAKALNEHGIKSVSVKFSGNKGFHIGVPFEAFPKMIHEKETRLWFPDGPRRIAAYLVNYISQKHITSGKDGIVFGGKFKASLPRLATMTGRPVSELAKSFCAKCARPARSDKEIKRSFLCSSCGETAESDKEYQKCAKCGKLMQPQEYRQQCVCGSREFIRKLDPFAIMNVDTILISSRHLYRMPYSLHEKSGLCSIVIPPEKVLKFEREMAEPDKVSPTLKFLDTEKTKENEAAGLIIQAFDFKLPDELAEEATQDLYSKYSGDAAKAGKEFAELTMAIPLDLFPPCIKNILAGIDDGRKRALFALINFLQSTGYSHDKIDEILHNWNQKNREQLREVLIKGQLRYKKNQKKVLPPNCNNAAYYRDIGVCKPDNFCNRIKNPVNYARLKARSLEEQNAPKGGREKLTEEQKEMRRQYRERMKNADQ